MASSFDPSIASVYKISLGKIVWGKRETYANFSTEVSWKAAIWNIEKMCV
jgi:hypothetical protein